MALANDPSWSEILDKSQHSFLNLPLEEKSRLGYFWFAVMRTTETLYHHYLKGNADASIWEAQAGGLENNLRSPGFREWWHNRGYPFTTEFTDFVNTSLDRVESSGEPYDWFGNAK